MDVEAFEQVHRAQWDELDRLARRPGRLSAAEADELVRLYQRGATHLSQLRSAAPDPVLVARLSGILSRARGRMSSSGESTWRDLARFVAWSCPAALYRVRWWTLAVTVIWLVAAALVGAWVAGDPQVQASLLTDEQRRQLVETDFEAYYSSAPATSFALQVWTNNAWIAAQCVAFGITGLWPVYVLGVNALGVGQVGGLMVASGAGEQFFGLILPHGLLELFAVFTAGAAGLRLFWAWVDPGPRPRSEAVAQEGRALITVAIGLIAALALSGVVEAFVTPSGLPTWARIGVGALALGLWLSYVLVLGRRAVRHGHTGDLSEAGTGAYRPVSG